MSSAARSGAGRKMLREGRSERMRAEMLRSTCQRGRRGGAVLFEQVRMGAGIEEQQSQFFVILFPDHQPVRFDVAFPLSAIFSTENMWMIFCGE